MALLLPATARAESHTGGVAPDLAAGHTPAAHRPAVAAHRGTIMAVRLRPRVARERPAPAPPRPAAAPPARPLTAAARHHPDALPSNAGRALRARTPHHRAWASRRRGGSRPGDPPRRSFVIRPVVVRATMLATGAGPSRAARTDFGPRQPPRRDSPAVARGRIAPSRDREPTAAVNSAQATAPVSLPAPSWPPSDGAEGFANSPGSGAAGDTAAALLVLLGALFVGALLPGLLGLDVLSWRSAVVARQLERPG
jgi:hypothetical protein